MKPLILIASDDPDFFLLLGHILEADGFVTVFAGDVEEVLLLSKERRPQAVLVDCRTEGLSGAEICSRLRRDPATSTIPVLALIRAGAEDQLRDLLKAGVTESLIRPVAPSKMLDFLRSTVDAGQVQFKGGNYPRNLRCGTIELSLDTHRVSANGREVHLSPIEFRLLLHMMHKPGQVISRKELINAAWPQNVFVDARTVNVHVGRLRRLLMAQTGTNLIRTVRSAGYALNEAEAGDAGLRGFSGAA